MKKLSFQRARGGLISRSTLIGIGAGVVVLIFVILRAAAPDAFFFLASPFLNFGSFATNELHIGLSSLESSRSLIEERDRLRTEVDALTNENRRLSSELAVRTVLLGNRAAGVGVIAGVVARPPITPYDILLLAKGNADGVAQGAFVTASGGIPVGIIESASAHSSRVSLFSLSGHASVAWIGTGKVPVTLIGEGAGTFAAELPKDAKIVVGDTVFIAPGGVPFGTVLRIDTNPSSPSEQVRIQPFVNPFTLTEVLVLPENSL
ncbi:MAG: hypothetical protein ABA06_02175 [Parcubacteria bacterium C7867-001]|nr:MAG: hypothetical protein ABA06_02175 [Parcubacteria bacterium C7867-001]